MATTTQTRFLANRATDWSDAVTFNQVDPADGPVDAALAVTGFLTANAWVENQDTAAAVFSETDAGTVTVANVATNPQVTLSATLGAFDGVVDSAGTSGRFLSGSGTGTNTGTGGPGGTGYQLPLYGTGTFMLPAYATARISATGPGNMAALFQSIAAASATLTTSTPATPGAPTTGGTTSGGLQTVTIPAPPIGAVTSATQVVTLSPETTGWTRGVTVAGFNPQLGTLFSVNLSVDLSGGGSYDLLNLDPVAAAASVSQQSTVTLDAAGGVPIATTFDTSQASVNLPGYAPGTSWTLATHGISAAPTHLADVSESVLAADFTGNAPVSLLASGAGTTALTGPGNLGAVTTLSVGATISVSYTYVPATDPLFDASYYLAHNPDVAAAKVDPLQHYLDYGRHEGRNPSALFDTDYYLQHNPDVAAAGVDPLQHYETYGWKEGRDPSASFSTDKYLAAYGDVKAAGVDPLLHYEVSGQFEGRSAFGV